MSLNSELKTYVDKIEEATLLLRDIVSSIICDYIHARLHCLMHTCQRLPGRTLIESRQQSLALFNDHLTIDSEACHLQWDPADKRSFDTTTEFNGEGLHFDFVVAKEHYGHFGRKLATWIESGRRRPQAIYLPLSSATTWKLERETLIGSLQTTIQILCTTVPFVWISVSKSMMLPFGWLMPAAHNDASTHMLQFYAQLARRKQNSSWSFLIGDIELFAIDFAFLAGQLHATSEVEDRIHLLLVTSSTPTYLYIDPTTNNVTLFRRV